MILSSLHSLHLILFIDFTSGSHTCIIESRRKNMFILLSLAILILLIYIFISHFIFKKKWHIKESKLHPFKANRSKAFRTAEIIVLTCYLISGLIYINVQKTFEPSTTFISTLIFLLLFSISIIRGLEIWKTNRESKAYYYEFSGAFMFILLFILFYFGQQFI